MKNAEKFVKRYTGVWFTDRKLDEDCFYVGRCVKIAKILITLGRWTKKKKKKKNVNNPSGEKTTKCAVKT